MTPHCHQAAKLAAAAALLPLPPPLLELSPMGISN
jgi:hypothetical protein